MKNELYVRESKLLSAVLRHKPSIIGIELDKHGWADTKELVEGMKKRYKSFTMDILEEIVKYDNKQRYKFNDDKTKIRANQGHSIKVDIELKKSIPPDVLYHGTATKYEESIDKNGLKKKSRNYVHLSSDIDTAKMVGERHGDPVIYRVDCKSMKEFNFYISENGVWLVDNVPSKYLSKL